MAVLLGPDASQGRQERKVPPTNPLDGALLLTLSLVTDFVGFVFVLAPTRYPVRLALKKRVVTPYVDARAPASPPETSTSRLLPTRTTLAGAGRWRAKRRSGRDRRPLERRLRRRVRRSERHLTQVSRARRVSRTGFRSRAVAIRPRSNDSATVVLPSPVSTSMSPSGPTTRLPPAWTRPRWSPA